MSYRIEEKLSIDSSSILEFKKYLSSKSVKEIYELGLDLYDYNGLDYSVI